MKYKHLFFDLDQTIAPSRQPILSDMRAFLGNLQEDVVVVTGQTYEAIAWQTNDLPAIRLGQSGNYAVSLDGKLLWENTLSDEHRSEIMSHIAKLRPLCDEISEEWTPVEDRGGQVTFSPVGNTAPVEIKMKYDPSGDARASLLEQAPFVSDDLLVKVSGSTCFDYIHKDQHKGTNIARLIDEYGWDKDECVYFGDRLYPGGNDEVVIGVIDTVAVDDHLDCYEKVREMVG